MYTWTPTEVRHELHSTLHCRLDVRNPSQAETPLGQNRWLPWLPGIQWVWYAIPHGCHVLFYEGLQRLENRGISSRSTRPCEKIAHLRPVTVAIRVFEELSLADKLLLCRGRYGHHASVADHTGNGAFGRAVEMGRA